MNAQSFAPQTDRDSASPSNQQRELLECILAAEVLTLAHVIRANTSVIDESITPGDFHQQAIDEIKQHRSAIIARLAASG